MRSRCSVVGASEHTRPQSDVEPTVQHGPDASACALPVLTYQGAPVEYPRLARPWGGDDAHW